MSKITYSGIDLSDEFLLTEIRTWLKDYEKTQPHNVMVDEDSFDGSAYYLLQKCLSRLEVNILVPIYYSEMGQGKKKKVDEDSMQDEFVEQVRQLKIEVE